MNASAVRHPMKCDIVVIRNVMSNGIIEHPAMVTRRFSDRVINIMVFPDGGHPYPLQDVDFFQSRKEALRYLSVLGNPDKDTKLVAYWPDTLETMGH